MTSRELWRSSEVHPSDGWIFLAIAAVQSEPGPTLDRIVEAADALNKAMPLPREIEGCVNRLMERGLLWIQDGRFCLSPAAVERWHAIRKVTRDRMEERRLAEGFLRTIEPKKVDARWRLAPDELDAAEKEYRRRFRAKLRELRASEKSTGTG